MPLPKTDRGTIRDKQKDEDRSIDYGKYDNARIAYRKYTINRMRENPTGALDPFNKFNHFWFPKKKK